MGKGRGKTYDKEYSELQKVRYENQKLKKEVARLRNRLARMGESQFKDLAELMEEEETPVVEQNDQREKNGWECHSCSDGFLEINMYAKLGEIFYFRECNQCLKRTKSQRYHKEVKGIIKRKVDLD